MDESKNPLLTENEVLEVLNMANQIYSSFSDYRLGSGNDQVYTPYLLNQNLVDLNNNEKVATYDKILKAFQDIKGNADILRGYSEWLAWTESVYAKTLDYFEGLLSFDLNIIPIVPENKTIDFNSKEYKADRERVNQWLRSFDYKKYFKRIVKEMLRNNVAYTWLRESNGENPKRALQIMPQKYCIITGETEICPLYDFDMTYFTQAGTSLKLFPKVFEKYSDEVFDKTSGYDRYNPANVLSRRNGTFALYHQTSIEEGAFCFMFNDGNYNAVPPFMYMMRSAVLNPEVELLQRDKDFASAYSLLVGEIKTFDDAKSGTKANQFTISPKVLSAFLNKVQSGLKKNVRPVAMPTTDNKHFQFVDQSPQMASYKLSESASQGASANSLIYSTSKPNQQEHIDMILNDYNHIKGIYSQFNAFLNYFVNKVTKKYKFEFEFDGLDYQFYRDKKLDTAMKMAEKGFVLNSSYYASIMGIKPYQFDAMLKEGHNGNMLENLSVLYNVNTMRDSSNNGGRPKKNDSDLTSGGQTTREYGDYQKGV